MYEENTDLDLKNVWQKIYFNSVGRNTNGTNKDLSLSLRQKQNVVQRTWG